MKKKAVVSSLLTIALCLCLIAGSTYAMFTADTSVNIAVNAANVALTATVDPTVETSSLGVAGTNGSFANGGAAILNDYEPGPITEKTVNGHKALFFEAKLELPANEEFGVPARTLHMNYVILLSEEEGYMLVVGGHAGLDVLEKIAENLEVRTTGETVTAADYESSNVFFNITQG